MSASERLRALMAAAEIPNHGEETWEKKMAWDRYNEAYFRLERLMRPDAALPLIADCIEAAEWECGASPDTAEERLKAHPRLRPALAALREALEGGDVT